MHYTFSDYSIRQRLNVKEVTIIKRYSLGFTVLMIIPPSIYHYIPLARQVLHMSETSSWRFFPFCFHFKHIYMVYFPFLIQLTQVLLH
jgi:hypothetical protein